MQYFGTISEVTQNHHDWVTFSLIQDLVDPLPGGGRKRSIATVSSQVAFGPVDPRRCAPVKVLYVVLCHLFPSASSIATSNLICIS